MDLTNTQLVLVLIVVPFVLCAVVFVGLLAVDDLRAKRRARRVDPMKLDGRADPVEQAYADNGFASVDDRIRAAAAADAAEAAFVSPGHARVEAFLTEVLGRRQS